MTLARKGRVAAKLGSHWPMLRDIALTSGARIYSMVLSIVALALTARWLGPEGRGIVVVVTTWVNLFATIGYLSLGQVCIHRAANARDQQWLGSALGALLIVASVATLAGWAVLALLRGLGPSLFRQVPAGALALGFVALPFLIWEQYGSALLSIIGRLQIYNINQIVARTLGLAVMIVGIGVLGAGIYGFLIAFVLTQAVVASAGIAVLLRHSRGRLKGGLAAISGLVRDGMKIHLNSIGVLLFSGVDVLMLQYYRGAADTGLFQLPMQLFLALLLAPQSALLVLQSRVASKSRADFWAEHRAIMVYVTGGMTLVGVLLWLIAPLLITLMASNAFKGSVPVFRILLLAVPVAAFNTLMGIQWIIRGYFYRASIVTFAAGALNCGLNLFLIPRFGAQGAAMATVIGVYAIPLTANSALAMIAAREARTMDATHAPA